MARREVPDEVLATRWCAPTPAGVDAGQPLACIATTFGLHAKLLEEDLLPRFLGLRYDGNESERAFVVERELRLAEVPVHVLVDAGHADPTQSTLRWAQLPVRIPGAFQHAKVTLLLWEHSARLIVGSANLTLPGYRRNREIAGVLDFFDGPASAPREVASDALDFVAMLSEFAAAAPPVLERLAGSLDLFRRRLRKWRAAPEGYGPRDDLRVSFIGGHPRSPSGIPRRSVMDQLLKTWGRRSAAVVRVVTPFVGDIAEGPNPVAARLAGLPSTYDMAPELAVPGREVDDRMVVPLPRAFLTGWAEAWGIEPSKAAVCVPPLTRGDEDVQRELHAKAIFVATPRGERSLLLAGSSNFTLHGMGVDVGVPNAEANLCWVGPHQLGLSGATPVDWSRDRRSRIHWEEQEPSESEEGSPPVFEPPPHAFEWATWNASTERLVIGLAASIDRPARWSIHASARRGPILADNRTPIASGAATLELVLPTGLDRGPPAVLHFHWFDDEGAARQGSLLVQIEDPAELPAPEELAGLGSEWIIDALLTGRDPAELVELDGPLAPAGETPPPPKRTPGSALDVDTSSFTLYRVRRLGRALAELSQRIANTVPTWQALDYRLRLDPLGPLRLAEAIRRDWTRERDEVEVDPVVFGLAEIALAVVRAGLVHKRTTGTRELLPLFRRSAKELVSMCLSELERVRSRTVLRYVREVRRAAHSHLG